MEIIHGREEEVDTEVRYVGREAGEERNEATEVGHVEEWKWPYGKESQAGNRDRTFGSTRERSEGPSEAHRHEEGRCTQEDWSEEDRREEVRRAQEDRSEEDVSVTGNNGGGS